MRTLIHLTVGSALLVFAAAHGAPAPSGSEEEQRMREYGGWFLSQSSDLGACCSLADGRMVNWRINGDHYEVTFLHPETVITEEKPQAGVYYTVEKEAVLHTMNPTGSGIAWWSGYIIRRSSADGSTVETHIRCFAPDQTY